MVLVYQYVQSMINIFVAVLVVLGCGKPTSQIPDTAAAPRIAVRGFTQMDCRFGVADPSALPKARARAHTCIVPTTRSQWL
jgi:hypothetical protein